MQELLTEPQLERRRRMSALQVAHSGGLRMSAALPSVVGSGAGAWLEDCGTGLRA